jgi:hypothetical protein
MTTRDATAAPLRRLLAWLDRPLAPAALWLSGLATGTTATIALVLLVEALR